MGKRKIIDKRDERFGLFRRPVVRLLLSIMIALVASGLFMQMDRAYAFSELLSITETSTTSHPDDFYGVRRTIELTLEFNEKMVCSHEDSYNQVLVFEGETSEGDYSELHLELDTDLESSNEIKFTHTVRGDSPNGPFQLKTFDGYCYVYNSGGRGGYNQFHFDERGDASLFQDTITVDSWGVSVKSFGTPEYPQRAFKAGDVVPFEVWINRDSNNKIQVVNDDLKAHMSTGGTASYTGEQIYDHGTYWKMQFQYTVQEGDDELDLDVTGFSGSRAYDLENEHEVDFRLYDGRRLSDHADLVVDGTAPQVTMSQNSITDPQKSHELIVSAEDQLLEQRPGTSPEELDLFYGWTKSSTPPDTIAGEGAFSGLAVPNPVPLPTGIYYLHIRAVDDLGNSGVTTFGPYHFDNEPPDTVTFTPPSGLFREQTVTVEAEDADSEIKQLTYWWEGEGLTRNPELVNASSFTVHTLPSEGQYALVVVATDEAGNEREFRSGEMVIDRTPPEIAFHRSGNTGPAQSHEVTVTVNDEWSDRVRAYEIWSQDPQLPGEDDERWSEVAFDENNETLVTTPADENGTWYLFTKAIDEVGNTRIAEEQGGFELDNIPPDLAFSHDGNDETYANSVETQLQIDGKENDHELADYTIYYVINNESSIDWADIYEEELDISSDGLFALIDRTGEYYIHIKVYDPSGNASTRSSGPFLLDHEPPTGSVQFVHEHTNDRYIQAQFTATDNITAVEEIELRYALDDGPFSQWYALPPAIDGQPGTRQIELFADEGMQTVKVEYRDDAGNISVHTEAMESSVTYDITAPVLDRVAYSTEDWTNESVTVTVYYTDNFSPSGSVEQSFGTNGNYTIPFADLAGNTAEVHVEINQIDKEQPEISFEPNGSTTPSQTANTIVHGMDNVSRSENIQLYAVWSQDAVNAPSGPSDWSEILSGDTVTLADENTNGNWYLWVKAVDEVGNENTVRSLLFLLDNTSPVPTIDYSTERITAMPVTATLRLSEQATVTNNDGKFTYTFTENGRFEFIFEDLAGNMGAAVAEVNWIDTSLPSAEVTTSPDTWTNETVDVTIRVQGDPPRSLHHVRAPSDAELIHLVTLEQGTIDQPMPDVTVTEAVYRLHSNGTVFFSIRSEETGDVSETEYNVNHIDKVAPTGYLAYSRESWTNDDVTVTLHATDDRSPVTVDGGATYTFTENGEYTFTFRDEAGNQSQETAVVDWIDKEAPNPIVTYSKDTWTTEAVTAFVHFDNEQEPVTITNNGGRSEMTFHENNADNPSVWTFVDVAGNTGQVEVVVDWIDHEPPTGTLAYNTDGWTNEDVTVTLHTRDNSGETATITSVGGNQHTFTDNGQFTFEFVDAAGNTSTMTASVNMIDKKAPQATVRYSTTEPTNATVRVSFEPNEPVTVRTLSGDVNGGLTYDFMENGTVEFEIRDRAGNTSMMHVEVTNIDRTPPVVTMDYSTTERTTGNVIATVSADKPIDILNNYGRNQYVFRENGTFTFIVQDKAGNVAEALAEVNQIDTSKADISLVYSETEPTANDVTVMVESDRPLTFVNHDSEGQVSFTRNGMIWLEATDELGNEYLIEIAVTNIDKEAPDIQFMGDLIVPLGEAVNPLADVSIIDNLDGDLIDKVTVSHRIDSSQPGNYDITYEVTDRAGNQAMVERTAIVADGENIMVFVNNQPTPDGRTDVFGNELMIDLFGEQGETVMKWAYGRLDKGEFKTNEQLFNHEAMAVQRQGYYTFLVQDQERHYRLIHVYVIPQY